MIVDSGDRERLALRQALEHSLQPDDEQPQRSSASTARHDRPRQRAADEAIDVVQAVAQRPRRRSTIGSEAARDRPDATTRSRPRGLRSREVARPGRWPTSRNAIAATSHLTWASLDAASTAGSGRHGSERKHERHRGRRATDHRPPPPSGRPDRRRDAEWRQRVPEPDRRSRRRHGRVRSPARTPTMRAATARGTGDRASDGARRRASGKTADRETTNTSAAEQTKLTPPRPRRRTRSTAPVVPRRRVTRRQRGDVPHRRRAVVPEPSPADRQQQPADGGCPWPTSSTRNGPEPGVHRRR